jgi:twinkle protein
MRPGEVWVIGAGTGVGKSDFAAEIVATQIGRRQLRTPAVFNYEAGALATLKTILGKLASKRFNIPDPEDGSPNLYWSKEDMEAARIYRREKCAKLYINDHKGAIDWASVKERLRYLRHEAGITLGVVDPVAAWSPKRMMTARRSTSCSPRPRRWPRSWRSPSYSTRTSPAPAPAPATRREAASSFATSGARGPSSCGPASCSAWSGTSRRGVRAATTLRVLKDRFTGDSTGKTRLLVYNTLTGRLEENTPVLMEGPQPAPLTAE